MAYRTFRVVFIVDGAPRLSGSIGILRLSVILKGWTKRVGKKPQTLDKYRLKWDFIFSV